MLSLFRKWFVRKDGGVAIEFSLLSIPYVFLSIGIIELAVMYAAGSMLEGATGSAARLIRTGQIQQSASADPEALFRAALCGYAGALVDCNDVQIEVQTVNSFADVGALTPNFNEDGAFVSSGFSAGGVNDRVLIRAVYRYPMMTPFVGPLLTGTDNARTFISHIVLQTEPYEFTGDQG